MKVYLAGGFKSGWQKIVKDACIGLDITFLDPSEHGFSKVEDYGPWDVNAIRESNYVFAYMEDSNPAGYALGFEIGIAFELGINVIFVNSLADVKRKRYFEMIEYFCLHNVSTLEEGIQALTNIAT